MTTTIGSLDLNAFSDLYSDSTQYFWFEPNASATYGAGAHITLVPDTSFISNPAGQNILMNTDGFSIRNGLLPMMVLDNDSLDFNMIDTTLGTYTTLASFGLDGAFVQTKDDNNNTVEIAHLGYGQGTNSSGGISKAPYYTLGTRLSNSSVGNYSMAEGVNNKASGYATHAEGNETQALGYITHAEGYQTIAYGGGSHTEGINTQTGTSLAPGFESSGGAHAEGFGTLAVGRASHAQNYYTKTSSSYQTAIGQYNDATNNMALYIGNGTADNARSNALTVDWSGNVNIASGAKYKINGTNLSASDVSAVALSDKYTRSSAGDLGWTNQTDGNAKVIAKSALAFWNGAYSGNGSNLSKCSTGNIIGSNGGTMTGQLLTSFKTSVAMGSYGSAQATVNGLAEEVRFSSGCAGSANITTAYTKDGVTIPTGWYNFMYMPHRSGGKNGAADGDNVQYGNLFLFGMNNTNGRFVVRVSSGSIAEVVKLVTTADIATTTATPSIKTSTGTLVASSIARSGKLRTLFLRVKNSSAISAGSNVYVGTLSTTSDRPAVWANGVGYYGSAGIMFQLKDTGEITGRVIGAQVAANGEVYASLTYVVS